MIVVLHEDDTFRLSYEVEQNTPLIHCTIKKFSHKLFRRGLPIFLQCIDSLHNAGYPTVLAALLTPRLAEMSGGEYSCDLQYGNYTFKVYQWKQSKSQV